MALESLPKIAPALFSAEQDLIQIYNKKSDTVGTINASYIGGSTPPSGVSGAIQFSNGSAFASDSANLFWDDTNKRLGVGTNAPAYKLEVQGNGLFRTTTSSTPLVVAHSGSTAVQIENNATGNRLRLSTLTTYASIDTPDTYLTINPNGVKTNIGTSTNLNATLGIKGSGSTSATTSLLVQNSGGNNTLQITDDGVSTFFKKTQLQTSGVNEIVLTPNNATNPPTLTVYNVTFGGKIDLGYGSITVGGGQMTIATGSQNININTNSTLILNPSRGVRMPRLTTAEKNAIPTPDAGLVVYDTTLNKLCVYTTAWETITSV